VAKTHRPLSSRVTCRQATEKASKQKCPSFTLQQPRRIDGSKRGRAGEKKRSFWRKLWLGIQIGFVVALSPVLLGYFIYEKALVYYAAPRPTIEKLDDLNVTSTFTTSTARSWAAFLSMKTDSPHPPTRFLPPCASGDGRGRSRFYQHGAIDYWGILRALREDLSKKSRGVREQTIEQQLPSISSGDFSRTLGSEIPRGLVAIRLEQNLDQGPDL